jgi:hypothetical protein
MKNGEWCRGGGRTHLPRELAQGRGAQLLQQRQHQIHSRVGRPVAAAAAAAAAVGAATRTPHSRTSSALCSAPLSFRSTIHSAGTPRRNRNRNRAADHWLARSGELRYAAAY